MDSLPPSPLPPQAAAGGGGGAAAPPASALYELHRDSSVGKALIEALDELVGSGAVPGSLALYTLDQVGRRKP